MKPPLRGEEFLARKDTRELERLGYAQELLRGMGGFSNFAISFSNISILTGAVTLFDYGLTMGGPLKLHSNMAYNIVASTLGLLRTSNPTSDL